MHNDEPKLSIIIYCPQKSLYMLAERKAMCGVGSIVCFLIFWKNVCVCVCVRGGSFHRRWGGSDVY